MQIHAALRFVTERPQAVDGLAIEIQFGGVLQAQGAGACGLWRTRCAGSARLPTPALASHRGPGQKTVGHLGLGAIEAGARDARRGLVGKARRNFDQPLGQPCIAQLRPAKLFHCPTVHALHCAQRADTLRHPPLTAGNRARKYGRRPGVSASRGMMNELCARVCTQPCGTGTDRLGACN